MRRVVRRHAACRSPRSSVAPRGYGRDIGLSYSTREARVELEFTSVNLIRGQRIAGSISMAELRAHIFRHGGGA
eukprot:4512618-Lingulodinium_polyedra.AAC.1